MVENKILAEKEKEETNKIVAKPLPVDKEKAREIEAGLENKIRDKPKEENPKNKPDKIEPKKEDSPNNKEKSTEASPKKEKKKEKELPKKEEAVARGKSVPISKKHGMYICRFIKNKQIDKAIEDLIPVLSLKRAIPFKGEIPHRKGKMMSGRYPIKATGHFINLLKALRGNVVINGMDLDKTRIFSASTSWASRPARRDGREAKRVNVILKAKEFDAKIKQKTKREKK